MWPSIRIKQLRALLSEIMIRKYNLVYVVLCTLISTARFCFGSYRKLWLCQWCKRRKRVLPHLHAAFASQFSIRSSIVAFCAWSNSNSREKFQKTVVTCFFVVCWTFSKIYIRFKIGWNDSTINTQTWNWKKNSGGKFRKSTPIY